MKQIELYRVLEAENAKIISFEDLPPINGCWRVNFFYKNHNCEIISNRSDGYIKLISKSVGVIKQQKTIDTEKTITDDKELDIVRIWLSFSF